MTERRSRVTRMLINVTFAAPCVVGSIATTSSVASAQAPLQPLPSIDDSIDYSDYPRLPPDFSEREPLPEPESLLQLEVEADTGLLYDSNIFRTPAEEESDLASVTRAQALLIYDGPTVDAEFGLRGVLGRHLEFERNNYEDFAAFSRALWGDRAAGYAELEAIVRRGHTAIGADLDEPDTDAAEVTKFYALEMAATGAFDVGSATLAPSISMRGLDYQDSERLNGETIDNDGKDRIEVGAGIRLSLPAELGMQLPTALIVDGGGMTRFFGEAEIPADLDRDSTDVFSRAGVAFGGEDDALQGEFGVGPALFVPSDPALDNVLDVAALGRLEWEVDPTNAIGLTAERRIRDTLFDGASAIVSTSSRISYVNQTTDDLTLSFGAGIDFRDYRINADLSDEDREDILLLVEAEVGYRITEDFFATVSFSHVRNDSSEPTVEYDSTRVFVNVGFDF